MNRATLPMRIDGVEVRVAANTSVAAAILNHHLSNRSSGNPERSPWSPLCGMGVCWGCRATIDGQINRRACLVPVASGMEVQTSVAERLPEADR